MSATVRYSVADGIATITLDRPEVLNAFGSDMREALYARLRAAADDDRVVCVALTGAGRAFCVGDDIAETAALLERGAAGVLRQRALVGAEIVKFLRALPKPVVAAVNGPAAGVGMSLALACDFRYAASSASFSQNLVKLGLVPEWASHYLLPRLVGGARALELMMTGESIDAEEALRLGLVERVFDDARFLDEVHERLRTLAGAPAATLALIKEGVQRGLTSSLPELLAFELRAQSTLFLADDARARLRAALAEQPPR